MNSRRNVSYVLMLICFVALCGAQNACDTTPTSDDIQQQEQERILREGTAAAGMPAIKNFRERKILKDILELRDQEGLVTYTYVYSDFNGRLKYFGETIGYGIPYATQYSNPQKIAEYAAQVGYAILPQADPNGLFSPASAEGTWVLMKEPDGDRVLPIYIEPRIVVSPFKLPSSVADYGEATAIQAEQQ